MPSYKVASKLVTTSRALLLSMLLLLAAVCCLSAQAKPSPEQIAKFQETYDARLDAWLATKTNETATCIDGLIN